MFAFDRFVLDPGDRMLRRDDRPVELSSRYLDALALLVSEQGRLVSKERFFDEVWRGIPVTDEALTQCIRTLRKELGDDAGRPRFIETVPKHGYRFIGPVERLGETTTRPDPQASLDPWRRTLLLAAAGTIGGGIAGFIGGLIYGFAGASQPLQPGMGAISVLLVLLCLTILVAVMGGIGVAFAGLVIPLLGGRLMAGSLDLLAHSVPGSRLRLDYFGQLFGESDFGLVTQCVTGALEGTLFAFGLVSAMMLARRHLDETL
jgi:DNA-binding winged helix-turn-helix (wHTH) protein